MQIGFSTADFYQEMKLVNSLYLEKQLQLGAEVIEVSVGRSATARAELMLLPENYFASFKYRFLHAPAKVDGKIIEELVAIQNKFHFEYINFHPDQLEETTMDILADSGLPICLENMDSRKLSCRTVIDMKQILDRYHFGMVLDLNHCYSNGGNMELVQSFWSDLGEKIRYFHLSGFITLHEPLFQTKQRELIDFVESKNRPVVIESMLKDVYEMEKEWRYIIENILDR